ncbi:MAG: 2-amino-4-hydroxy-6-hydroxymethyldihydropteridine diphosphokinase [Candidatus Binatia bacterium]
MPHQVYIGIGSNQGKKKENYLEALGRIAKIPKTRITRESSFYESEPIGESKDWYVNGVIEVETELEPEMLLKKCKNIERAMGRKKVRKRWGARIVDLDILLYDNLRLARHNLKIPHPEMHNRKFVLIPLSEIAPQLVHPDLGMTISQLLVSVKDDKKVCLMRS